MLRLLLILCVFAFVPAITSRAEDSKTEDAGEKSSRAAAKAKGKITFDDLKFDLEKGDPFDRELLTEEIEKLNDKVVELKGYILPVSVFQQSGIKQFVLVRDNQECCFGPGAALYDCVMVEMQPPHTAEFSTRPITVKGKFNIKEFKYPDGGHYAIYQIKAIEAK